MNPIRKKGQKKSPLRTFMLTLLETQPSSTDREFISFQIEGNLIHFSFSANVCVCFANHFII